MAKRNITNLLALAVLSLLHERPMHPYEIGATMRQRKLSDTIKLNTGSLYAVVDSLLRKGWIEPIETQREGKHPERTIYGPTEAGQKEFFAWLKSLLRTPQKEYYQFAAGLSFLAHISPVEAIDLFEKRISSLESQIAEGEEAMKEGAELGLDRLFQIESEYKQALLQAEYVWIKALILEIKNGSLTHLQEDGQLAWSISYVEQIPSSSGE